MRFELDSNLIRTRFEIDWNLIRTQFELDSNTIWTWFELGTVQLCKYDFISRKLNFTVMCIYILCIKHKTSRFSIRKIPRFRISFMNSSFVTSQMFLSSKFLATCWVEKKMLIFFSWNQLKYLKTLYNYLHISQQ